MREREDIGKDNRIAVLLKVINEINNKER